MIRVALITSGSLAAALALNGCEPSQPDAQPPTTAPVIDARKPVLWKSIDGATVVAVDDAAINEALQQATVQARTTLNDARTRWAIAKAAEKPLWAIKWAAPRLPPSANDTAANRPPPIDHGTIEYVWVQPLAWSAFRIEGVLLSQPTSSLECGKSRNEVVSFPIEEVSDWIHFASEEPDAAYEGGYTVRVLEAKYGEAGG